jgi:hypothetical protein
LAKEGSFERVGGGWPRAGGRQLSTASIVALLQVEEFFIPLKTSAPPSGEEELAGYVHDAPRTRKVAPCTIMARQSRLSTTVIPIWMPQFTRQQESWSCNLSVIPDVPSRQSCPRVQMTQWTSRSR